MIREKKVAEAAPVRRLVQTEVLKYRIAIPAPYAPRPKKAAWPKESIPVYPNAMLYPKA
jgi:hypothetical protein